MSTSCLCDGSTSLGGDDLGGTLRQSVPAVLGVKGALRLAAVCHLGMVLLLFALPLTYPTLGWIYFAGILAVAVLLAWEHWLVRPDDLGDKKPKSVFGAFLVGLAFAFGWTPCIGPILTGILALAGVQDTVGQGVRLLAVYSLGLGVPFLIAALAIDQFFTVFAKIRKYYHAIEVGSGLLLCAIGVLIFTDRFTIIARWLSPYLPTL